MGPKTVLWPQFSVNLETMLLHMYMDPLQPNSAYKVGGNFTEETDQRGG